MTKTEEEKRQNAAYVCERTGSGKKYVIKNEEKKEVKT